MKKRPLVLLLAVALLAGCAAPVASSGSVAPPPAAAALVPNPLPKNNVAPNPYMAQNESAVHNDSYSSDVTDAVLPLGILPVVSTARETEGAQAPPAIFFDDDQNAVMALAPGVAIRDIGGEVITTLGRYDTSGEAEPYLSQISYAFVDSNGYIVAPTNHGHVVAFRTTGENGAVLERFEKVLDIDVVSAALEALGPDIDKNLLSIVYDYEGNLWFATGSFRVYPDRNPAGFVGYVERAAIEAALAGEKPGDGLHFLPLKAGEGAENGISSNPEGVAVLTNRSCHFFTAAPEGVQTRWSLDYPSGGAKDADPQSGLSGGGLAWGGGSTPTLTNDLVLFTDNQTPVNLLAVSAQTGRLVASAPVLENLAEPVSVENSIIVYSADESRASAVMCNWFGAGSAGLANPDADPSKQSYATLYDENWIKTGNACIAPGIERIDIVKDGQNGYTAEKVWVREDLRSTSMFKLSTATGYLYGYLQDIETGMWQYIALDWDTGETALTVPVSAAPAYNNMAVGMIIDTGGNGLYCPTNDMVLVRLQDDFARVPASSAPGAPPQNATRRYLTDEELSARAGGPLRAASYLMGAPAAGLAEGAEIAFLVNGLAAAPEQYLLYRAEGTGDETLAEADGWRLVGPDGQPLPPGEALSPDGIYELRVTAPGGGGPGVAGVILALREG